MTPMKRYLLATAFAVCGLAGNAMAQNSPQAASLPAWEQLTSSQREELIAPMRDRWNRNPGDRQRMFDHARRWQTMTPDQRKEARKGMHRWERMDPQTRAQARALFDRMRTLDPEQRQALRRQWKAMTPDQRKTWLRENPAAKP